MHLSHSARGALNPAIIRAPQSDLAPWRSRALAPPQQKRDIRIRLGPIHWPIMPHISTRRLPNFVAHAVAEWRFEVASELAA